MSTPIDLQSRVAQLELHVAELQHELHEVRAALELRPRTPMPQPDATALPTPLSPAATAPFDTPAQPLPLPPPFVPKRLASAEVVRGGEYWFNKVGIGLLLLGLAFLFKYAVDQGWLTPAVRVGIGLLAGVALLGLGLRLSGARRSFAEVLMGGGIGALYLSGFAAFQLYQLITYPPAFGFMCLVTALAFGLGLRQNAMVLALIATIGGLATPFLLYSDSGNLAGLVGYTSIVIGGALATYLARGWWPLLWAAMLGGWAILLSAGISLPAMPTNQFDRWAMQGGIIWTSLLLWPLPIVWLLGRPVADTAVAVQRRPRLGDLYTQVVMTPFLALMLTAATWDLGKQSGGWLAFGLAAVAVLAAWLLQERRESGLLAYVHLLAALLLVTAGLALLLEGNALLIALAVEAALAHLVAGKRQDRLVSGLAHLLFGGLLLAVLLKLFDSAASPALLNLPALTSLAVLGLAVAASLGCYPRQFAMAYWLVCHLLLLGLLGHELAALPNGNGYVTIAWGIYGVVLLVTGLHWDKATITLFGIGTLLLVVAKLLLVDLAALAAIWRILLFLGFGGAFLLLSYYFRALWRPAA